MPAYFFIAISWFFGYLLIRHVTGGISSWRAALFGKTDLSTDLTRLLTAMATAAASLWTGLLLTSWSVYLFAWLSSHILPSTSIVHPLLPANILCILLIFVFTYYFINRGKAPFSATESYKTLKASIVSCWQPANRAAFIITIAATLFFLIFSSWLMLSSFSSDSETVSAGYTVFSDFAPHTAIVSSFSAGRNWPTVYPHFAGDGISYHFMFFFLCGNLNWLGLPIGLAINIPSILGMVFALILLGILAVSLTDKIAAFAVAPLLTLARSSMAFFTWLGELIQNANGKWSQIIPAMKLQRSFIGNTPRDDWGLWTINVYANQRHLMPALALMLFIIMLFLPQISRKRLKDSILSRNDWLGYNGSSPKPMLLACLLLFFFAYFHGSVLIATLSMLAIMSLFSRARIYYLMAAFSAIAGALLQIDFFSSSHSEGISVSFLWGFIAEDKSFIGVISYLLELTGPLIPLALLIFVLPGRRRRVMLTAAFVPLVIAFTLSLTPDVTVNHKFLMITQMMLNIWIAQLLISLISGSPELQLANPIISQGRYLRMLTNFSRLILPRLAAVLLVFTLIITGLVEWRIYANANNGSYTIKQKTEVTNWIINNTSKDAVFITAPWHFHSFFLTGRNVWLGHSYYAWSAGHNTGRRSLETQTLLAGDLTVSEVLEYAKSNNIDYLLIDDDLRSHEQFTVNESFYLENFSQAAIFTDESRTIIYDLRS